LSKFKNQVISDEILEKLKLENRYKVLNDNLSTVLTDEEFAFLKQVEDFCMKFEKDNNVTHSDDEDFYPWTPTFGQQGYITRQHAFECLDLNYKEVGLAMDLMRTLALTLFDPQFAMSFGATTIVKSN